MKALLEALLAVAGSFTNSITSFGEKCTAASVDWFWRTFASEIAILDAHDVVLRMFVATLCGALVGLEREAAAKPAGLRTNVFICTGSALFTLAGIIGWEVVAGSPPTSDPMRVAAQIVTGVGFLCAGVIYKSNEQITGITTAATVWFVSAIGMMVAIGFPLFGFLVALTSAIALFTLGRFERLFPFLPKEKERPVACRPKKRRTP